jgi:hypothetical protein
MRLTLRCPGKQHGQGAFRYADGTVHAGSYKHGRRNGNGTFKFADGAEHSGEYKDDCMCERGACCCFLHAAPALTVFLRHGWGTFKYANGNVYTGEFFNGTQHGRGTLVYADGRREDGEFKHDKFVMPTLMVVGKS